MALDATVRARVDSKLKDDVEEIFSEIGLTTSQAINMFLKGVKRERGIPFELKIPLEYKIATDISNTIKEVKNGDTKDIKELLDEL